MVKRLKKQANVSLPVVNEIRITKVSEILIKKNSGIRKEEEQSSGINKNAIK